MATSVKSKAELEQVALAMMMMAGGEGTSSPVAGAEVGVKTRSSRRTSFPQVQNHQPTNNLRRSGRGEPVSGNYLNKNKNRRYHDQPGSPEDEEEYYEENHEENEEEDHLLDNSPEDESATDLVVMKPEGPDEAIICAINPLSIQSSPSPGSPAGSLQSTNSGSGGSGAGGAGNGGNNVPGNNSDCIYMSSSRRIFRPEFKQRVLDAFASDPECVGNQRATARKFGIHRRQVQKWLQQLATGELSFKESQQQPQQNQGDNEDPYSEPTELTSRKLIQHQRSSQGNPPTRGTGGKAATRRSTTSTNRDTGGNNSQESNSGVGRASDPPNRPTRSSARNRGNKSMPLKGGSKSTAQYVSSTVVHPSAATTSSAASSPLMNLSKGGKNPGGGKSSNATATSSTYAYYSNNDSNGNSSTSANSSNMFMNMSTLLASAAAAGNLTMPLSLENPRNFSPRDHSPINNNGRGSPAHSAGGSSGGSNSTLQNALLLVDELSFLYPYSDFSLLRKALLKEEVSLEKLAHPLIRGNKSTEFRVNGNGFNTDLHQGLRELRRAADMSPSPLKSATSRQEYTTQQTLDIIQQQQEYLKLLQQCGIGNSSDLTSGLNLADLSNNGNNGRIPAWFNPFAAAAAAGLSVPSTSSGKFASGSSGPFNVNGSENNSRRTSTKQDTNDNHRFASPRIPPAVNSNKAKTVAAALAATRVQPSSSQQQQQQIIGGRNYSSNNQPNQRSQNQKNAQRKKVAANSRQAQAAATRAGAHSMDEDMMIDPTSMLEVVTSIPSPSNSPATRSNQYGYNGGHQRNSGNSDYQQGMDLSTTSSSVSNATTAPSSTRLISKAMNKEYSFLNELGLIRKSPEESTVTTTTLTSGKNGYGLTHTASLENFVENILPPRQKSPQACSSSSSSSPPASDLSDSEKTKSMVLEAFAYDPEISGDTRAVARKFGLNVRVVMKWLKEAPAKNSPSQGNENGLVSNDMIHAGMNGGGGYSDEEESKEYLQAQLRNVHTLQKAMLNESNNNSTGGNGGAVNRRKNSKPNQICDFPAEAEVSCNGALDMVVPIKKRRVSSPNPTSHDA